MLHTPPDGIEERRRDPQRDYWKALTLSEKAAVIAAGRFNMQKPSDFDSQGFPGGERTREAVLNLLNRIERRRKRIRLEQELDPQERIRQLEQGFNISVGIWEEAGLFTPEREKAGYAKPDFKIHYLPRITQEHLALAESGEGLDKGYNVPSFAPMDVPLYSWRYSKNADTLSYFKLLEQALIEAFHGTMGGKQPNTLLIGPDKRQIELERVNVGDFFMNRVDFVFEPKTLDPKNHNGLSEQELLASLTGVEKQTGGILRLERPDLIMPDDVNQEAMSSINWHELLKSQNNPLPKLVSYQNLKEMLAYAILCLKTQGWIPDVYAGDQLPSTQVCLAPRTFVPSVSLPVDFVDFVSGNLPNINLVPSSSWDLGSNYFVVGDTVMEVGTLDHGVRGGVRIN